MATIHVDRSAAAAGNGTSWDKAFGDLQDGLAAASSGDEIWVARGTYAPTSIAALQRYQTPDTEHMVARMKTFGLDSSLDGVGLYGGFAGTETTRDERDWFANPSILSGAITESPEEGQYYIPDGQKFQNSYRVLRLSGVGATTVVDGFTISGGAAMGGSYYNVGGGIQILGQNGQTASPTLRNLVITGNMAGDGGGIYIEARKDSTCSPSLTNIVVSGNYAGGHGGGLFVAAYTDSSVELVCTNLTITANRVDQLGGAIFARGLNNSSVTMSITNSILCHSSALAGGDLIYAVEGSSFDISSSLVEGGFGEDSKILVERRDKSIAPKPSTFDQGRNKDADPRFVLPLDPEAAPAVEGDFRLRADSPAIDAGENTKIPDGVDRDLSAKPRKLNNVVDIGAYEQRFLAVQPADSESLAGPLWSGALPYDHAMDQAEEGTHVYLRQGTHTPPADDSFHLASGVEVYGGFVGTETYHDERDWQANTTRLTVDDLTQPVFIGQDLSHRTVLDGVLIHHPSGDRDVSSWIGGAGVPTLRNLWFDTLAPSLAVPDVAAGTVSVDQLKVTQTVQNPEHTVPLVVGKRTIVRAVVSIAGTDTDQSTNLMGLLQVEHDGGVRPLKVWSEQPVATTGLSGTVLERRAEVSRTLNFALPNEVVDAATSLTVSLGLCFLDQDGVIEAIDVGDHTPVTVQVNQVVEPFKLRIVGLRYVNSLTVRVQPRSVDYQLIESWLRRAFPVPSVDVSHIVVDAEHQLKEPVGVKVRIANGQVAAIRNLDMAYGSIDARTHYYGLVLDENIWQKVRRRNVLAEAEEWLEDWEKPNFMRGAAEAIPTTVDPSVVSAGPTGTPVVTSQNHPWAWRSYSWDPDDSFGDWYAAHEIGHTLGRSHVATPSGGEVGPDTEYPYLGGRIGGPPVPPDPIPVSTGTVEEPVSYEEVPTYEEAPTYDEAPSGEEAPAEDAPVPVENVGFDSGDERLAIEARALPYVRPETDSGSDDVMSYGEHQWLSDYTYKAILARLQAEDALPKAPSRTSGATAINVVLTEGDRLDSHRFLVNPLPGVTAPAPPTTGNNPFLRFVLKPTADGPSHRDVSFTVDWWAPIDLTVDPGLVPGDEVTSIEYHGRWRMAERDAEGNPLENDDGTTRMHWPEQVFSFPVASAPTHITPLLVHGSMDAGLTRRVSWASDGRHHYTVQIRRPGGGWEAIAVGLVQPVVEISMGQFDGQGEVEIRVLATNGIEVRESEAVSLTADPVAPGA